MTVCTLNPLDRRDESFAAFATRKGVEGFVVRVDEDTRQVAPEIAADNVPHVVIADRFEDPRVNYVCCNSMQPSREAIEHLVHLGHRRIALCHNTIIDTDHRDRIDGYHAALAAAEIESDAELVISTNAEIGAGAAAFNRLMSLPNPPTAIFITDPAVTVGALRRALEVGVRVPDELSIVGFDDERLRKMTHPVYTSVCQNAAELGHQAGRWLCRQLRQRPGRGDEPATLRMEIDAFLEINQTTAPPPATPIRVTPDRPAAERRKQIGTHCAHTEALDVRLSTLATTRTATGVYADRTAGGRGDHRVADLDPAAVALQRAQAGPTRAVPVESEATGHGVGALCQRSKRPHADRQELRLGVGSAFWLLP